jgi:hypothetical protein
VNAAAAKVTASHLARNAYLYVRQSTLKQVLNNTESGARQYAPRQRAAALGWPVSQVITITPTRAIPVPAQRTEKASST